jgi:hypothetical protein
VQVTHDAGRTWAPLYHSSTAVWSVDLLAPRLGWIVGVADLRQTADGGRTFRQLSEPGGHALVRVQFSSPTTGIGVTTDGAMVLTRDGGATWLNAGLDRSVLALCASRNGMGYAVTSDGDLMGFTGVGGKPSLIRRAPAGIDVNRLWASLECSPGGGYAMSLMQSASDQVAYLSHLTVMGDSPTTRPRLIGAAGVFENESGSHLAQGLFGSLRNSRGGAIVLGWFATDSGPFGRLSIVHQAAPSEELTATSYDSFAGFPPHAAQSITLEFAGAAGFSHEVWAYALADGYLPAGSEHRYVDVILHSPDDGATWRIINVTAPRRTRIF